MYVISQRNFFVGARQAGPTALGMRKMRRFCHI